MNSQGHSLCPGIAGLVSGLSTPAEEESQSDAYFGNSSQSVFGHAE